MDINFYLYRQTFHGGQLKDLIKTSCSQGKCWRFTQSTIRNVPCCCAEALRKGVPGNREMRARNSALYIRLFCLTFDLCKRS